VGSTGVAGSNELSASETNSGVHVRSLQKAIQFRRLETPQARQQRIELRRLWNATVSLEQLSLLDNSHHARLALHREAAWLVLRQNPITSVERLYEEAPSELQGRLVESMASMNALQLGLEGKSDTPETLVALRAAHQRLLEDAEKSEIVLRQAKTRLEIVLGLFGALILAAAMYSADRRNPNVGPDLAAGCARTQSSIWAVCQPEKGLCGGFPTRIAFHTHEEMKPWFQIDLAKPVAFSKVWIRNRSDMSQVRAVPLIVEVSLDGITFKQVARKDEKFSEWTAEFSEATARFVRLRVDRKSILHLEDVRVLK
jgi:F5/8 type C domain